MSFYYGWAPRLTVAERRVQATREAMKMTKQGKSLAPIRLDGKRIATTWWGNAWCTNLESYSDYDNRLPRGRSYVRSGSVLDLQISPAKVTALVSGSSLYEIEIAITPLKRSHWQTIVNECAGQIGSVVELLQGRFSQPVMEILARQKTGLFPSPKEIALDCSCPDWASMCKHVAAALYGVGARLDAEPELLFALRKVDQMDLVSQASATKLIGKAARGSSVLRTDNLGQLFGVEFESTEPVFSVEKKPSRKSPRKKMATKKATRPSQTRKRAAVTAKHQAPRRRKADRQRV